MGKVRIAKIEHNSFKEKERQNRNQNIKEKRGKKLLVL